MNIQKATNKAIKKDKFIARRKEGRSGRIKIKPQNNNLPCEVINIKESRTARGWEPKADDLTANDWCVVD
ncbi:Thoeris anti-defense Tad2 family protein [[Clostridium] fimetarium]|uniref:Thoeris anti-defense 2-like domain-containing protein n=1 Tax=[Clostridium] fimetarium TaxID=99656 RepID=A0A1I0M0L6_9FIRM|nr:MW1434 family type I TA system toxin [[Clostridium] fimetarium]SEV81641.1 hypothetical protein SAMN05421659_10130 [[Clostridium] fimetarium]